MRNEVIQDYKTDLFKVRQQVEGQSAADWLAGALRVTHKGFSCLPVCMNSHL